MPPKKDISGQSFGNLKAIRSTGEKERGSYIWEFECICGNRIEKRIGSVTGGQIVSCGCYKAKNLVTKSPSDKMGQKFGTNISRIKSGKVPRNNTSGHKGVSLFRSSGKSDRWCAYIYFKGHRYHLGCYENIDDAITARQEAESRLFGDFLEWYQNEKGCK